MSSGSLADEFAEFFENKITAIRNGISAAPVQSLPLSDVVALNTFAHTNAEKYLTMTTGDTKNNLRKLCTSIKAVEYRGNPNVEGLSQGKPEAFLDLYRHAFLYYSRPLFQLITEKNIDIAVKGDARFMEAVYKVLREVFALKPPLTQTQFFSRTYAEKKMIMCTEILLKVREKHKRLLPRSRSKDQGSTRKLNFPRPTTAPVKSVDENDSKGTEVTTNVASTPADMPSAVFEQLIAEMNKRKLKFGPSIYARFLDEDCKHTFIQIACRRS
ncbi:hypothetical protein CAPTEDRAFT_223999 [Capitella teleta]|uniref:Centrosomal protein of 44 kDa n=1 Tax=Capitella teleta TaxID=283909 RepID=R7V9C7_CAPTE|nr:hypothetical protein CAPTEDRAFT_223999 [Capitella teleta]|eukprot:ELU15102.1 hypothetical protein CAPTEDRAFT_223999 [Capitella teleta]